MLNFHSDELRRNPFPVYDQARSVSPVLQYPGSDIWMILDYDSVKRALNDHEAFSSSLNTTAGHPHPEWLIFFDPPRHTKLRGIIMSAFTPRVVANLETRIRELSSELLDPLMARGEMDLAADYAVPLPMKVIAEMIGIPIEDWPRFRRWSDAILKLSYTVRGISERGEEAAAASQGFFAATMEMQAYLPELIEQRKSAPRDDLLTRLVAAEVDGERLTPDELLGFFQLLLVGGNETTTNLINNAMLSLMENPDQLAKLRAHPELLPSAIEEVLRYRSPFQWTFRGTRRDVELRGRTIPAGKLVLVMIGSANRDPQQFHDPHRFDITRDPNPHVAFGHGVHFCLGAALSRLEARLALSDLLQRMESFELAGSEPWEPRKALHVHGPARLPVRFQPGRHAAVPA